MAKSIIVRWFSYMFHLPLPLTYTHCQLIVIFFINLLNGLGYSVCVQVSPTKFYIHQSWISLVQRRVSWNDRLFPFKHSIMANGFLPLWYLILLLIKQARHRQSLIPAVIFFIFMFFVCFACAYRVKEFLWLYSPITKLHSSLWIISGKQKCTVSQ